MEAAIVFIGLFGILFVIGAALGLVAFTRLSKVDQNDLVRIPELLRRVAELERRLGIGQEAEPVTAEPVPPPVLRPPVPRPPFPVPPRTDLETVIAGRWLNRVGLLLVFLAAFYALKWEFDNNVLGPTGRVALWTLVGAGLVAYGQWLAARGHRYLADGLTGLGGAVLYLTLYFGWSYYKLFPPVAAFVAMILVTAAMLAIAVGRDSQRVALLGLIGGFATPLLASQGQDAQVVLFSYLLILDAGVLVLARARTWRGLEPLALLASTAFFWGWYDEFYHHEQPLVRTALFATAFFAVFTALPVIRARVTARLFPEQVGSLLFNAANYLSALYVLLWPGHRWGLTLAVVALAALHLLVTEAIPPLPRERPVARMVFAGLALTLVALAIPIRLEGHWVTIAWAVHGAVLVWSGFRVRWSFLRGAGLVLYGVTVYRLLVFPPHADVFLLNARFAASVVVLACVAAALALWRRQTDQVAGRELGVFQALGVTFNVLAVWALSLEVDQYFTTREPDPEAIRSARLGGQLTLSLLWTAYSTALVVTGVRRAVSGLRWQGLALFGIVVAKVFFLDLSYLSGGYRVLSSIVLGIVLLAVSFLYQRGLAAQAAR